MVYTVKVDTDAKTVKDEIASKAKEVGFGVLKEYKFRDLLEEKGHPIEKDITLFEVCYPPAAQKALTKYPEISVYLPCRISVYEEDGKTVLQTISIDSMLSHVDVDSEFKKEVGSVFETLKGILNSWK